jgi:hypothetical protein
MPALKQRRHFKLPANTAAGRSRQDLRSKFAEKLGVSNADFDLFLCEAISVIIPSVVKFHQDSSNDTDENFSGTLTLNCSLPTELIENGKLKDLLRRQGYGQQFPFSVILYDRAVCRTYETQSENLHKLSLESSIGLEIVKAITDTRVNNKRNFHRLFDHDEEYTMLSQRIRGWGKFRAPFMYDIMVRYL